MRIVNGRWVGLACLIVAVGIGCSEGGPPRTDALVADSAGVRVIALSERSSGARRALEFDHGWPADTDMVFGELVDVEVTRDGETVVLDRMNTQVTVLSADGQIRGAFGRPGEGPGEFSPFGLFNVLSTDSTILIPDTQLQRVTEFSMDGRVVDVRRMLEHEPIGAGVYAVDWRHHPEGGLAARVITQLGDIVVQLEGNRLDTIYMLAIPREHNSMMEASLVWALDAGGRVVAAQSDRPEISAWDPVSQQMNWITRGLTAERPVTDVDAAHLANLLIDEIEDASQIELAESDRQAILAGTQFPSHAPVISAMHVSPEGRYWVQGALPVHQMGRGALRVATPEEVGGSEWWVLSEDGLLEEIVHLPEGFRPRRFVGPWIYGITSDELGAQYVGRVSLGN